MKSCGNCKYQDTPRNYLPCIACEGHDHWADAPSQAKRSNVEHPAHYAGTSIECIDAMVETQGEEAVKNFCICNAFKYLWRHAKKNGVEDVKKAAWYLNKFIELEEKKDEN